MTNDTTRCHCGAPATHAIPNGIGSTLPACGECFRKRYWSASDGTALIKHHACGNCGGAHHIQQCPAIRARLFDAERDTLEAGVRLFNVLYLLTHEDRIPAFAAPVAEPWGVEPWPEAA